MQTVSEYIFHFQPNLILDLFELIIGQSSLLKYINWLFQLLMNLPLQVLSFRSKLKPLLHAQE